MVTVMRPLLNAIFLACCLKLCAGLTDKLRLLACDDNERHIVAAHITTGSVRGKLECYYVPQGTEYGFRIRINKLNLKARGTDCPVVRFIGYTSKMEQPDVDEVWNTKGRRIRIPADPEVLAKFDCNNYLKATGKIIEARKTGQKLVMEYDTKNIQVDRLGDVDFIITSFLSGSSYSCPADHFRCWSSRYVCIDSSIECDTVDNCYDDSDEENFRCTGKILGLLLPLFIVIVVLICLLIIGIIVGIVLVCRRRRRARRKLEEARQAGFNYHGMTSPYYLTSSQHLNPRSSSQTQLV